MDSVNTTIIIYDHVRQRRYIIYFAYRETVASVRVSAHAYSIDTYKKALDDEREREREKPSSCCCSVLGKLAIGGYGGKNDFARARKTEKKKGERKTSLGTLRVCAKPLNMPPSMPPKIFAENPLCFLLV
jgi:hypothetical protein